MLYSLKFVGSDQESAIPILDFKDSTSQVCAQWYSIGILSDVITS